MTDHAAWLRMHAHKASARSAALNSSPSPDAAEFIDGLNGAADHIDALTAFVQRWTAEASDFYVKGWADAMNHENVPEDGAA